MQLPRSVKLRVEYALSRTADLRTGRLQADPRWLTCIEETYASLPEIKRVFFRDFFIRHLSNDEILYNHYIEHTTLYAWRDEIYTAVALRAAVCGLIRVIE